MDLPSGVKQAALVLHGLSPDDREWMLAQLPPQQVPPLRAALDELSALGIPRDATLTRSVAHASRLEAAQGAGQRSLANANAQQVAAALRGEPPSVVQALLNLGHWRWRDELRRLLHIGPALTQAHGTTSAAFQASLASAVAVRLPRSAAPVASTHATARRNHRLVGWWSALSQRRHA